VVAAFAANPDFAVVMGRVIRDGATNAGLGWPEALQALAVPDGCRPRQAVVDHVGAYGCNMSIRASLIGDMRFDERLVLYGWQEDIDFTSRLRARGRVVCVTALRGVHLGIKAGRVSGRRFGYSQVVNPVYLIRKRSVPAGFALRLMLRNLAANLVRSIRPEPYVDRRGRLRGNLLGLLHVMRGRVEPEHALRI
jgi:GT2 family glycosyltransferase